MRRSFLAPLLLSAGCLYLGDLNHAPVVESVDISPGPMYKGFPIQFVLTASDREDTDSTLLTLRQPIITSSDGGATEGCDYTIENESNLAYTVEFLRAGTFKVGTQVQDTQGAVSTEYVVTVPIVNAPPSWQSDSKLTPASSVNFCGVFSVGQGIPIQVIDPKVTDVDQSAGTNIKGCPMPETLTYTWTITPPLDSTMAVLTKWDATQNTCVPMSTGDMPMLTASTPDQVCLWPDYGMQAPTSYHVALTVSDGGDMPATLGLDVPVEANSLPCISGVSPVAGSFVVDPANPEDFTTLTVEGVKDDLDPYPPPMGQGPTSFQGSFHWSLWRESDPVWRDVATTENMYSPDYSIFGVGEHIRVRVEADDRSGMRAAESCPDPDIDLCQVTSCIALTCYQWMTWDLELR